MGRFISADSIIPDAKNPLALDRYAYSFNSPINYLDPSGHGPWYIAGWDDQYLQKQTGNTCAVVSMAVALSITYETKITQKDVQTLFPNTYFGIGVPPFQQQTIDLDIGIKAAFSQGTRADLLSNLNSDLPTIVSIALPRLEVGHAVVAIGFDPITNEIWFFNPATGSIASESQILSDYNKGRGYTSFDELWSASNLFIPSNSMVTVQRVPLPMIPIKSPPHNQGGGNSYSSIGIMMR